MGLRGPSARRARPNPAGLRGLPAGRCASLRSTPLFSLINSARSTQGYTHFVWPALARRGPYLRLTRPPTLVVFGHPDNAASPLKWRGQRSTALPEMVAPTTTGQEQDRAVLPQGTDGHLTQGAAMSALEPLALSPREAAAFLSVGRRTLSRLIATRQGCRPKGRLANAGRCGVAENLLRGVAAENRSCPACVRPARSRAAALVPEGRLSA